MESLSEYLGVFSSAAVAAVAAGFGGFIWSRIKTLNNFLKDEEVRAGGNTATRIAALEGQVRDLKVIAADALARASRAVEAAGGEGALGPIGTHDREAISISLLSDLKAFHKRLANALSYPPARIDDDHMSAVLTDLKTLDQTVHVIDESALTESFHAYRDEVRGLIDRLVTAETKSKEALSAWDAATDLFERVYEAVNGSLPAGERDRIRAFTIRTQDTVQSWS